MPQLHLFGGEKGGVGKSFVARTVTQYCLDRQLPFTAFDTDRSNPDLKRTYGTSVPIRVGILSEGEKYEDTANQIYNAAITQRVLVNLPAAVFPALKTWIETNDLLTLSQEDDVQWILWFVSDGGFDSLNLLRLSLSYFQGKVKHVVVKNRGRGGDDWEPFETDQPLQTLMKAHHASLLDFPRFPGNSTRNRIDAESLTFKVAQTFDAFTSIDKQRVRKFIKEAYAAIDTCGVFKHGTA